MSDAAPPNGGARSVRRLLMPAAIVLAIAAIVLALLARPAGTEAGDVTEHVVLAGYLGPVEPGGSVRQSFVADRDGLTTVAVRLASPGGDCDVVARLRDEAAEVATGRVRCEALGEGALVDVIDVDPIEGSARHRYQLELQVVGTSGYALVGAGPDDAAVLSPSTGSGVPDGNPDPLEIHSDYATSGTVLARLDVALDRLTSERPWWQQRLPLGLTVLVAIGALAAISVLRGRAGLVALTVFVVAKGLLWTAILPPFHAPDEPAHYAYSQFLAEELRLPERDTETIERPDLYSPQVLRLAHLVHMNAAPEGDRPDFSTQATDAFEDLAGLSPASGDPDGNGAAAGYPPAYYLPGAVLYGLGPDRVDHSVQFVRWSSIAFGVVLALAAFAVGRRLFDRSEGPALALAVAVTAQPMISQQTATINNDAMVIAVGACALALALELTRPASERNPRLSFWATFAVGLSMLAKSFGAAMAPVVLLGWIVGRWRTDRDERPPLVREAALAAAGLAVTYGLWTLVAMLSGFQAAALADFDATATPLSLGDYLRALRLDEFRLIRVNLIDQLWGDFGWLRVPLPVGLQHAIGWSLWGVVALAVVWIVVTGIDIVRGRRAGRAVPAVTGAAAGALLLVAVAATLALLFGVEYPIFRHGGGLYVLQGRYFLIGVPALLAFPAVALRRLAPRVPTVVPITTIAAAMVVLNIVSVAVVVEHFYL